MDDTVYLHSERYKFQVVGKLKERIMEFTDK